MLEPPQNIPVPPENMPGNLENGRIDDLVAVQYGAQNPNPMTPDDLRNWGLFQYIIPGTTANNIFAADPANKGPWSFKGIQHLKVHGWDVSPDYQREEKVIKTNVPADIFQFNESQSQ